MIEVKEIQIVQLDACAELYVKVFNCEPWNDSWTVETAYKRLADIFNSPGFVGITIHEDEELRGAAFGCMEQWYEGMEYSLKEIFIANECQGKGLGKRIMKELETRVKVQGGEDIVLFTSRETAAYGFYIKEGFHELKSMAMLAKNL
jgi:aminoglycoside 6'-N-acetyltransferase I